MRRVLSLWLPMFAIEAYRRRTRSNRPWPSDPGTGKTPEVEGALVLVAEARGALYAASASPEAQTAGIAPGMTLADARMLVRGLAVAPADPEADASMLETLADWCGRYTPWTAVCGLDGLWLDITGCAHLFGGEEALMADLQARLSGSGFSVRLAVADTPGAAWALARYGGEGMVSVMPGGQREALAPLPAEALRLSPGTALRLGRLGFSRIRDIYPLPRAALAARFGAEVGERLDRALGRESEPISPRRPQPRHRARLAFAEPVGLRTDIEAGLGQMLAEICDSLERTGQGCRRLVLDLFHSDGGTDSLSVGTAYPARDAARLARLFAEPLDGLATEYGIETMTLAVTVTEPLEAEQLNGYGGTPDTEADAAALAPLLDRLGNRLGFECVVTLDAAASHLPDRAQRARSVSADGRKQGAAAWSAKPHRPLRLLARPEPIEVIAGVALHEPPSLFRWRRVNHHVRAAAGPERIAPDWWRADRVWRGGLRDYWRIEDREGRRFWVFCEGGGGRAPARWYLHGLFA